jgi:hypothetical protein
LRADHDRDRELDQVPAHYEILEATHGTTFLLMRISRAPVRDAAGA